MSSSWMLIGRGARPPRNRTNWTTMPTTTAGSSRGRILQSQEETAPCRLKAMQDSLCPRIFYSSLDPSRRRAGTVGRAAETCCAGVSRFRPAGVTHFAGSGLASAQLSPAGGRDFMTKFSRSERQRGRSGTNIWGSRIRPCGRVSGGWRPAGLNRSQTASQRAQVSAPRFPLTPQWRAWNSPY